MSSIPPSKELFKADRGPLSQINAPYLDIKSVVQLAVGAYGWWKARERVQSLAQVLDSAGFELAPCGTFNARVYTAR